MVIKMKVTKEILEDAKNWYLEGNSLRRTQTLIFEKYKVKVSKETLRKALKNVIKLRKREEALILAKRKFRKSFDGSPSEKAYLIGLCLGDLAVSRHSKFTILVATSSTKESFMKFLVDIFKKYTGAVGYIPTSKGYAFYAYLDNSFNFLLEAKTNFKIVEKFDESEFFSFLSGFIDAEGCIRLDRSSKYPYYVVKMGNTNLELLNIIKRKLEEFQINCGCYLNSHSNLQRKKKDGEIITSRKDCYIVQISNKKSLSRLLMKITPRYEEKAMKKHHLLSQLMV